MDRTQPDFQTRKFVSRVDLYPQLTTAIRLAGFSLIPSFAVRETDYGSSIQNGALSGANLLRSAREVHIDLIPPRSNGSTSRRNGWAAKR